MSTPAAGKSEPVNVRILDREYTVGVGSDERDGLLAAARLLDARMRELRGGNRMVAVDRLAVLAALNLAHELLQLRAQAPATAEAGLQPLLAEANRKLDALLASCS
ncbi:cell division protein ZapA [Thermomonas flagellata]|uniref:cell division protein ZapA n=1 Tax=Thermomonas flagellata TaxID=2888524 RepID=UPI001F046A34